MAIAILLGWVCALRRLAGVKERELTGPESWRLWNIAVRFLRWSRAADAEELASETMTRLIENLRRGEQVLHPDAYVREIARNVLREDRRRREREADLPQVALAASSLGARSADQEEAHFRCLERCKRECLSPEERRLIQAYYGGDSSDKISRRRKVLAGRMGLSENALRLWAFRLRRKLFNCIKECLDGNDGPK